MNILKSVSYLSRNSKEIKKIDEQIKKLPSNQSISKEILDMLNNSTSKVVLDEEIKNSYYVYLNDTLYISNRKKIKDNFQRVILISHEVIHSIQNKLIQKLNFAFSNLELIMFMMATIFFVFNINISFFKYSYIAISLLSIVIRLYLEINAVNGSVRLSEKYLNSKALIQDVASIIAVYKTRINLMYPLFILSLLFWKVIRIALVIYLF
ncbi:MAG: hypothetical protein RSB67_03530 [Clostridia bacterium]